MTLLTLPDPFPEELHESQRSEAAQRLSRATVG